MRTARVLAALLLVGCKGTDTGVHWDLERMVVQPRYTAYGGSDFFDDGRAMRVPPPGTVPRDAAPRDLLAGEIGAEAGDVERIPVALTPELLRVGRARFDVFCAVCHDVLGNAASPVAERMQLRPPPSLHTERIRAFPPGRLYRIIRDGYGLMPPYGAELSGEERWAVVAYVRALQLSQAARIDQLPDGVRAEALEAVTGRGGGTQ